MHVDKREYSDLCKFMKECREDRHWEVVYCWCKLIADHAFVFEASANRCGLEFAGKGSKANKLLNLKKPKGFESFFNDNEYKEVFESIRQTHGKYRLVELCFLSPVFSRVSGIKTSLRTHLGRFFKRNHIIWSDFAHFGIYRSKGYQIYRTLRKFDNVYCIVFSIRPPFKHIRMKKKRIYFDQMQMN